MYQNPVFLVHILNVPNVRRELTSGYQGKATYLCLVFSVCGFLIPALLITAFLRSLSREAELLHDLKCLVILWLWKYYNEGGKVSGREKFLDDVTTPETTVLPCFSASLLLSIDLNIPYRHFLSDQHSHCLQDHYLRYSKIH